MAEKDASQEQHESDLAEGLPHKPNPPAPGSSDGTGGACLNRHVNVKVFEGENKSCSHRWQAYLHMKADAAELYNYPRYKSLTERESRIRTIKEDGYPKYYTYTLTKPNKPSKNDPSWDVRDDNFRIRCYEPYWHEAHHVVPNSELRNAIAECGDELVTSIRRGLLRENYNLNYQNNMIMLPLDRTVAKGMSLPRHRRTAKLRSHKAYSSHIKTELQDIFSALAQKLENHEPRNYTSVKRRIETMSRTMYTQIAESESPSLDEMPAEEFVFRR
jgi:HNH/ENDO VII superfamily nuclease